MLVSMAKTRLDEGNKPEGGTESFGWGHSKHGPGGTA